MNKTSFAVVIILLLALFRPVCGQQPDEGRIEKIESKVLHLTSEVTTLNNVVNSLKNDVYQLRNKASSGAALFLFGVVAALWAQNSGRNPWLWFFLGLFFSVIAALVMLYKNSRDREMARKVT
jgi:outer membrane murein-binding lipoprotein Lpp